MVNATSRPPQFLEVDFGNGKPQDAVRGLLAIVDDINLRLGQQEPEAVAMLMTSAAILMLRANRTFDRDMFHEIAAVAFDSALIYRARRETEGETRQ